MIEVDLRKNHPMFRRAWQSIVGYQNINIDQSREVWLREFGCKMIEDDSYKFVTAVFDREEDYTAFVLRWTQ